MALISNRWPVAIAITIIIFLIGLWRGREQLPEDPLQFLSEYVKPPSTHEALIISTFERPPPRPSFYEIAKKYGTDKVTAHHYERMYEHRLAPLRDKPIKMLEIGLGCDMHYGPGKSYYTWLEYFPHVDLYYIEYDAKCAEQWAHKTEKATVFSGDQADVAFLERFLNETGGQFDVIIDDGGHTMVQQRTSLQVLWDRGIKPGGIYFIEDLATSYHANYGGGAGQHIFMKDLQDILDDMNKAGGKDMQSVSKDIVDFEFTQEVVALTKAEIPL